MIITRANFHDPSCWRRRIRIANTVCVASLPVRQLCHGAHFTPLVSFVSSDLPLFPVFLIREGPHQPQRRHPPDTRGRQEASTQARRLGALPRIVAPGSRSQLRTPPAGGCEPACVDYPSATAPAKLR